MALSERKVKAYAALEAAIEEIRAAFKAEDEHSGDDILTGWVVATTAIEWYPDRETADGEDELATFSVNGWYAKRGQAPVLSHGIMTAAIRHYEDEEIAREVCDHLRSHDDEG